MSPEPPRLGARHVVGSVAVLALVAAGLVLATSYAVPYPDPVLTAAWAIAVTALSTVIIVTWRISRSTGTSRLTALGQTLKAAGQFFLYFF